MRQVFLPLIGLTIAALLTSSWTVAVAWSEGDPQGPTATSVTGPRTLVAARPAAAAAEQRCRVKVRETGRSFARLQAAVDDATPGNRIVLRGTCWGTTVVDKDLAIRGMGDAQHAAPTLSGGGEGPVLTVNPGIEVAVRNLTVRDGEADAGAGILNHGDLTLVDVIVRNNSPSMDGGGGGIHNTGTLTLRGTSLIQYNHCLASHSAGGVHNSGTLILNDSSAIRENLAFEGADGVYNESGGVVVLNDSSSMSGPSMSRGVWSAGSVTLNGTSSIHDFSSDWEGGGAGVYVDSGGRLTLNDASSIHDNYVGVEGGGGGGVIVAGGTLILNGASAIHGNFAQATGGGVLVKRGGTVRLNDTSSITGNDAPDGGGVYLADGGLTLRGSATISGNRASWDGGGLHQAGGTTAGVICGSATAANVHGNDPDDCYCEPTAVSLGAPPTPPPVVSAGPAVGRFTAVGSLAEPRWGHTATALPDGRVLVIGGFSVPSEASEGDVDGAISSSAELWDPATGRFSPAGWLAAPRALHTSTLLADGRVLVVGGYGGPVADAVLRRVELWDPVAQDFELAGRLESGRAGHSATLLPDGRVLIVGGTEGRSRAEIWDPLKQRSVPAGQPIKPRVLHAATLLPDGRVVVIGGEHPQDARALDRIEVWDPRSGEFHSGGTLPEPRTYHSATTLLDGRVVVLGGLAESSLQKEVLVWAPETEESSPAGSLNDEHANHTATLLPDGRVLVIGGALLTMGAFMSGDLHRSATAERWDPTTGQASPAGALPESLVYHTATLLPDGRVLVVGGVGEAGAPSQAHIWEPVEVTLNPAAPQASPSVVPTDAPEPDAAGEWACAAAPEAQATPPGQTSTAIGSGSPGQFSTAGSLSGARAGHTATLLPDGRVLVVGGGACCPLRSLASAEIWDPVAGAFEQTGPLAEGRTYHQAVSLPDGRVLIVGGWGDDDAVISAELFDPATEQFGAAGSSAEPLDGSATVLDDGRVLLVGGWGPRGVLGGAAVWDRETETFSPAGRLAQPRGGHTATALADGRVLVLGGGVSSDEDFLAEAEVWDPATETFGPAGSLMEARWNHTATLLPDGRVLVIGGEAHEGDYARWAEVWDPADATFRRAGSLIEPRIYHTATLLPDGRILVVGGYGEGDAVTLASAEIWDPATERFIPGGELDHARRNHTATLLPDGRVLVVGGRDFGELTSAEVWTLGKRNSDGEQDHTHSFGLPGAGRSDGSARGLR